MPSVKIKVKHKRFLNIEDFQKLQSFRINARLNNPVYGEYTAHMLTELTMSLEEIDLIRSNFVVTKFDEIDNILNIEIDLQK